LLISTCFLIFSAFITCLPLESKMTEKAPAIDQDGKMINPHNPSFITTVPWYLGETKGPTLKHHGIQKKDHFLSVTETDALIEKKILAQKTSASIPARALATVGYRKGACKNCGSLTHKDRDCLERPRSNKKAAWKTGIDISPDDVVLNLEEHGKVSYSAKRDQWKGYDPSEFNEVVISRHERLQREKLEEKRKQKQTEEEAKKKRKEAEEREKEGRKTASLSSVSSLLPLTAENLQQSKKKEGEKDDQGEEKMSEASDSGSDYDSDSDSGSDYDGSDAEGRERGSDDELERREKREIKVKDEQSRDFQGGFVPQGGVGGHGMRVTVRNLRLREDTPKYLRNLALDSAFYDPKSRSMRTNPYPNSNPNEVPYAGDNFVRYTGR
jgi:pre-mRNA-processing factor SLU7